MLAKFPTCAAKESRDNKIRVDRTTGEQWEIREQVSTVRGHDGICGFRTKTVRSRGKKAKRGHGVCPLLPKSVIGIDKCCMGFALQVTLRSKGVVGRRRGGGEDASRERSKVSLPHRGYRCCCCWLQQHRPPSEFLRVARWPVHYHNRILVPRQDQPFSLTQPRRYLAMPPPPRWYQPCPDISLFLPPRLAPGFTPVRFHLSLLSLARESRN